MRELGRFSNRVLIGQRRSFDWQIALSRKHHLENHKDSHSIKDFFRLNPHEHENMDIDAIPKHHKFGFLYRIFLATSMLVTDVGDEICW